MDKIYLKSLSFYGYHGVLPEENELGQKFIIDLELSVDLLKAGATDSVDDTVCYDSVYKAVKAEVTEESYKLLEALAENICKCLFENFSKIDEIKLLVKKPEAPIDGIFDYVGVEITRKR